MFWNSMSGYLPEILDLDFRSDFLQYSFDGFN